MISHTSGDLLDLELQTCPLLQQMQQDFKWTPLPQLNKQTADAACIQHARGAPPIVHEHYSDAARKKAEELAKADVRKYMPVKPMNRGHQNLSNAVKQTMAEIEADLDQNCVNSWDNCIPHLELCKSERSPLWLCHLGLY